MTARIASLLALLTLATSAHAATLSLRSGLCDGTFHRDSTALSIQTPQGTFIVASADAVLASSATSICHAATDATGKSAALKLLRHDWASGLALFEAPPPFIAGAEALSPTKAHLLQSVVIGNAKGRVVSAASHRQQFVNSAYALEIEAQGVTNATLGEGVRAADRSLIGFISSHVLTERPGHSSATTRWLDQAPADHATLLALPAPAVQSWISAVLNASWTPTFVIDVQDQIKNTHAVTYGPLTFTERCPVGDDDTDPANPPIGGVDPVGIGGVDPVGIGGGSSAYACRFLIDVGTLQTAPLSSAAPDLGPDRATQSARVLARVKAGEKLALKMGYYRDDQGLLQAAPFTALEQMAQAIIQNKYGLLVLPDQVFTSENGEVAPVNSPAMVREVSLTAHGAPDAIREVVRSALELMLEVSRPWGLVSVRERSYLYSGLHLTSEWNVVNDTDLSVLAKDANDDQSSLMYVPEDVNTLIKARSAVTP